MNHFHPSQHDPCAKHMVVWGLLTMSHYVAILSFSHKRCRLRKMAIYPDNRSLKWHLFLECTHSSYSSNFIVDTYCMLWNDCKINVYFRERHHAIYTTDASMPMVLHSSSKYTLKSPLFTSRISLRNMSKKYDRYQHVMHCHHCVNVKIFA